MLEAYLWIFECHSLEFNLQARLVSEKPLNSLRNSPRSPCFPTAFLLLSLKSTNRKSLDIFSSVRREADSSWSGGARKWLD
jgi:hypothetical protein